MKIKYTPYVLLLLLSSCTNKSRKEATINHVVMANRFVDAFYSFNSDSLQSILSVAKESQPYILYYQKWAQCAHYKVINRDHYIAKNDSVVVFPVTVKDDLMGALTIDFNVTDTFHIVFRNGMVHSVTTSSNDPDEYYEAKEWVKKNKPEWVEKECDGIWAGGATPCECVLGIVKGFASFTEMKKQTTH